MAFASGPERNDDPLLFFFQVVLIKILNNGWIEKSSRLNRIFHSAIRTNEHLSLLRQISIINLQAFNNTLNVVTMLYKNSRNIAVATCKLAKRVLQRENDLVLVHGHYAAYHLLSSLVTIHKIPGNDSAGIRSKLYVLSDYGNSHCSFLSLGFSNVVIKGATMQLKISRGSLFLRSHAGFWGPLDLNEYLVRKQDARDLIIPPYFFAF